MMMPRGLWTTTVGSFPKPPHLERARNQFARGEITAERLNELEREATIEVIRSQEEIAKLMNFPRLPAVVGDLNCYVCNGQSGKRQYGYRIGIRRLRNSQRSIATSYTARTDRRSLDSFADVDRIG